MHDDLKPGSKWSDNDPRMSVRGQPRIVEVVSVGNVFATIRNANGRETSTRVDRFGKKGRIGFTLVSPTTPTE